MTCKISIYHLVFIIISKFIKQTIYLKKNFKKLNDWNKEVKNMAKS